MKLYNTKGLSKVPNGSIVFNLPKRLIRNNELSLDTSMLRPRIFVGNFDCKWDETFWNGMVDLVPFDDNTHDLSFSDNDINSGNDFYVIADNEDLLFNWDDDSNDYNDDNLFLVYNEEEKESFLRQLIDYLGMGNKVKFVNDNIEEGVEE